MRRAVLTLLGLLVVIACAGLFLHVEYAPLPAREGLLNPRQEPIDKAYDVLGEMIATDEAARLMETAEGRAQLSPAAGAVAVNDGEMKRGREAFYRETYGNEFFLTDVLGMLDGGLSVFEVARATTLLAGRGTNDLKVRLAKDVTLGDRRIEKGTLVSTGLDVPSGGLK